MCFLHLQLADLIYTLENFITLQRWTLCYKSNWIKLASLWLQSICGWWCTDNSGVDWTALVQSTNQASLETRESESNLNVACLSGTWNVSDNRGSQASDRVTGFDTNSRARTAYCTLCRTLVSVRIWECHIYKTRPMKRLQFHLQATSLGCVPETCLQSAQQPAWAWQLS